MSLPTTNRWLGERSKDVANISVELNPLVERGRWLPSVNEVGGENEEWGILRKFLEKAWMRVEINRRVGKDIY